jgi:ectoine hydroxylase-related dioxygenase (phytanoyl-CoA dioxygenase family)
MWKKGCNPGSAGDRGQDAAMHTARRHQVTAYAPHQTEQIAAYYHEHGYACVRGVFAPAEVAQVRAEAERIRARAAAHVRSFRAGNFTTVVDQGVVRAALWPALVSPVCDAIRTDARLLAILKPLIGDTLRSLTSQFHWKPPGSKVGVNFHTDRANRTPLAEYRDVSSSFVQTGLAVDPMVAENGPLLVVPGSHRRERVLIEERGNYGAGDAGRGIIAQAGYCEEDLLPLLAAPGDVVLWHPDTIHGSDLNRHATLDRCLFINGFIDARATYRGYWAWIHGKAVPAPGPWCPVPLREELPDVMAATAPAQRNVDFWSGDAVGALLATPPSAAD